MEESRSSHRLREEGPLIAKDGSLTNLLKPAQLLRGEDPLYAQSEVDDLCTLIRVH